jgi:hypothetical protein
VTPNFAIVEIHAPHWHMPRLWLPLFLLWAPAILLSPLILLVILGAGIAFRVSSWRMISIFWGILSSLPGTDVRVEADDTRVLVKIL